MYNQVKNADIIIPEGGHNTTAISLLVHHLQTHLKNQGIDIDINNNAATM